MKSPLTQFRKKQRMTLAQIGAAVGVNASTVMRWERDELKIPAEKCADLEKITGIPRKKLRPDVFQ